MLQPAPSTTSVLLVEDDRDDFLLTQDILQRIENRRYRLTWVGTYESARQELRERRFDVALVDYRIGERTGLDFIRDVGPFHPGCPMILLTGLRDPDIDIAAQQAGAADYLDKDSLSEELLDRAIRYACQRAQRSALLNSLLANANAGMLALDCAGAPQVWNNQALVALDVPETLTGPQTIARISESLSRLECGGRMCEELANRSGLAYEMRANSVPGGGNVIVFHDVTRRKEEERLLRQAVCDAEAATRAKSSFLATISHELRTPLNGILGMVRVLEAGTLDEAQTSHLDTIKSSGLSLLRIINDVLDLSKIEAGRMEIEEVEFNLAEIVDDVVRLLAPDAFGKGIELAAFVDPRLAATFKGDPLRLRQVLANLIGNAIKFTAAGSVTVWAGADPHSGTPALRFDVADTGIGIPSERADELFQPFVQVDASTTRKYGGTGLGLALCKQIVGLMGGRIWLESAPGAGSTFSFTLPLPAAGKTEAESLKSEAIALAKGKLLFVGPSAELAFLIESYARAFECELVASPNAEDALRAINATRFTAILADASLGTGEIARLAGAARQSGGRPVFQLDLHGAAGRTGDLVLARPFVRATFDRFSQLLVKVARQGPQATPAPAAAAQALRVLVAEDNPANQRVTAALLRSAGWVIEIAGDGQKAVELGASGRFDVILMDVDMPILDGIEATKRLRAIDSVRHVPIIALTAKILKEDRDRCFAAGMNDYLTKPVDWDKLIALLKGLEREIYDERRQAS
jgi:signal transduction histidine kinase